MQKSIMDIATDKLHERVGLVNQKLKENFKNTKPYRGELVPKDVSRYVYENLSPEDLNYAIQKYGYDEVNTWMGEMEMDKQRRKT